MGFFDKLFGNKAEEEETAKFFGQSKTVLAPIRGKVLALDLPLKVTSFYDKMSWHRPTSPTRRSHRASWAPAAASSPPARPCMPPLTAL